jgi:cysteine-rich repeat protein
MRGSTHLRLAILLLACAVAAPPTAARAGATCGNGTAESSEQCDDGNTLSADGCSAACTIEGPLDKTEQGCVNGVNAAVAGLVANGNRQTAACLKDVARGKAAVPFETCVVDEAAYQKTALKLIAANTKKCLNKSVTSQTAFGYNDATSDVIVASLLAALDAHRGVLGTPAAVALEATDKTAAKCQRTVVAGVSSYLNALAKETNRRKKASLKDKTAPALTSVELAADLVGAAVSVKVTKTLENAKSKAGKKCAGVALAPLFAGVCEEEAASAEMLLDCASAVASCELCQGLNAADKLAIDCSQYSSAPMCDPATPEDCGDGTEQFGEACDDGNTVDGDGCRANCTEEICGDGTEDPQEECDDGNTVSDDGCRADCTDEICGDGQTDVGEDCDDGNTADGDGCREDCTEEICGDGILDPQEECDEGDTENGDGCDANCNEEFDCATEGGTSASGACWFLGADAASCETTCADEGLVYDPATETVAGSGGSDLTCGTVLTALGFAGGTPTGAPCDRGLGCWADLAIPPVPVGTSQRCTEPTTDAPTAPGTGDRRACACTGD